MYIRLVDNDGYELGSKDKKIFFSFYKYAPGYGTKPRGITNLEIGTLDNINNLWQNIIVAFNQNIGKCTLYVNGEEKSKYEDKSNFEKTGASDKHLIIGSSKFKGLISNFMFFDGELNSTQVKTLYYYSFQTSPPTTTQPITTQPTTTKFISAEDKKFSVCYEELNYLKFKVVKIPEYTEELIFGLGIKKIDLNIFKELNNLKKIFISNDIEYINSGIFSNLSKLEEVHLGNSVKKLEGNCFSLCRKLKKINIPNSIKQIGPSCFRECFELYKNQIFYIGNYVEHIGLEAFYHSKFKSCVIPNTIQFIMLPIFNYNQNLETVIFKGGRGNVDVKSHYGLGQYYSSFTSYLFDYYVSTPTNFLYFKTMDHRTLKNLLNSNKEKNIKITRIESSNEYKVEFIDSVPEPPIEQIESNEVSNEIISNKCEEIKSLLLNKINKTNINRFDTTEFKTYNGIYPDKELYFNRNYLVEEGLRRNKIDDLNLQKLKNDINKVDENIKKEIETEIANNQWKNYIFEDVNPNTNRLRPRQDLISDYEPNIIGCPRGWMECHHWKK